MLRNFVIASLLASQAYGPAIPQTATPLEPVPVVLCPYDGGLSAGTAFRVGPHLLLSVNHVTSAEHCMIDGEPIKVMWASKTEDFSILSDDRVGKWIKVDCGGFVKGRLYLAVGHVRAAADLTAVPMIAIGETVGGQAILAGIFEAQPGMSGGPVIDAETHEVVGTINTGDWEDGATGSVPLKDTPICKGKA